MPGLNDLPKVTPSWLSRSLISSYAEDVARSLGYRPGDPVELVISDLGGSLTYSPDVFSGTDAPESIVIRSDEDFDIVLGTMASTGRDRFTMCHELGHLFVHYPIFSERHPGETMRAQRWIDAADRDQQRAEWEANWFASAFLMPEAAFKSAAEGQTSPQLARTFGVSLSSAMTRKKILGMSV